LTYKSIIKFLIENIKEVWTGYGVQANNQHAIYTMNTKMRIRRKKLMN